jgi:sulfur-carrier protein
MAVASQQPVKIVYFAWVREKVGRADETVVPPANVATIADLMQWLSSKGPEYSAAFGKPGVVRAAIDQVHVKPAASVAGAREIAFFPPVTGG